MTENQIDYLHSLQRFAIKPGLERIKAMMELCGQPHFSFPSVLVGGTNGKGSTVAFISSIMQEAGYRVGTYTSPHLISYRERFQINGELIPKEKFEPLIEWAKNLSGLVESKTVHGTPTEFEVLTAIAFRYFADEHVDIAVVEVGLGGRLDATNVLDPMVSVITCIELDHTDRLGSDHVSIAYEKIGIARQGRPLVTAERKPEILSMFESNCSQLSARLVRVGREVTYKLRSSSKEGINATFQTWRNSYPVRLSLLGNHQLDNFGCALAVVEILTEIGWKIDDEDILEGAKKAKCPARLQTIRWKSSSSYRTIILDGAHNPSGASALAQALSTLFCYKRLYLVIGILADKDIHSILTKLVPLADEVFVTQPKTVRATPVEKLGQQCIYFGKPIHLSQNVEEAVISAVNMANPEDLICVTGSLYVVGEALAMLQPYTGKDG